MDFDTLCRDVAASCGRPVATADDAFAKALIRERWADYKASRGEAEEAAYFRRSAAWFLDYAVELSEPRGAE